MNTYELLRTVNTALIQDQDIPHHKQKDVVNSLLSDISAPAEAHHFHRRVRASKENITQYPLFYIFQYAGRKKPRLLTGYLPKTYILSTNHYELEILRLLALWEPGSTKVIEMMDRTIKRLDSTCFGHFCATGECVGASVAALRFLSAVQDVGQEWINELLNPLGDIFISAKRQTSTFSNLPSFYFCLTLSGIDSDQARHIIRQRSDILLSQLRRGWLTGPGELDTYNVLRKYIIRNTLACLPEYTHLRNAAVYISEKDGRCYCDV